MTTAVQPTTPAVPNNVGSNDRTKLVITSAIGSLCVLAALAVSISIIPQMWAEAFVPAKMATTALLMVVQLVALVGIIFVGTKLAGVNPPKGYSGGIMLITCMVFTIFFLARAVSFWFGSIPVTVVILGVMIFFAVRYLLSAKGEEAMIAIEEGGWMSFHSYKRTQGLKVRRYTMIGVLLIGLSGVFSIYTHETFGTGTYRLPMPFGITAPVITTSANIVIPGLLGLAVLWLSWRMVNMPTFADFLIATEAEMNKVSWTSRKRLYQDTIVVLTTMFLMTLFLFIVDLFWGWLLSLKFIGVLPPTKEGQQRDKQTLSY